MKNNVKDSQYLEKNLLRSINIVFDANHPERIAHYFPTTKSIQLLKNLFKDETSKSFFVVAPYGSGKSLLGSFYMQLIENKIEANSILKPVYKKIKPIDKEVYKVINNRTIKQIKGIAIPLSGYVEDLPKTIFLGIIESVKRTNTSQIYESIKNFTVSNLSGLIELLSLLRDKFGRKVIDHIDIIWDEFGRHLEEIIIQGDAQRLNEIQVLSEFSSRSKKINMSLILFLHQSLMRYASNVPRAVTEEWKKIEARFETIQYVDDSKEITLLSARVLASRFPNISPDKNTINKIISDIQIAGFFHDLTDDDLYELVTNSYPVLPAALYVLPRISSRVAQNERTLFSFLFSIKENPIVTPAEVFDYFSDLMRADTTLGGTYHHWLETQNALAKADSKDEERIIKTLSLLSLGFSGERNRVSKDSLNILCKNYNSDNSIESSMETLIQRKLLLYRRNSNSVLLWHANDVDLRGRIESEKINIHHTFNLISYINEYLPLEGWRPLEYNINKNITRFYSGQCVSLQNVLSYEGAQEVVSNLKSDGVIWYFIPETDAEINEARKLILQKFNDPRIVILIPRTTESLFEVAIEASAIERLLQDTSLLAEDPLIAPELKLMLDDTFTYLMRIIDKLYLPSVLGPQVLCNGEIVEKLTSKKDLRKFLSQLMYNMFPCTPNFNNELINKRNPSKIIVNARKKLILGILDRYGTPDLGLDGNRPDKSMFETLLINTGLYRKHKEGHWGFAKIIQIEDSNLIDFWLVLKNFFATPTTKPKDFNQLYNTLSSPPLGIRQGLFPIFTAVGFRAFPSAVTLTGSNGEYIEDIMPSTIEEISKNPGNYHITIVKLSKEEKAYLHEFEQVFNSAYEETGLETDPIRRCFDALEAWKAKLPPAAFHSRKFSRQVLLFQKLIIRSKNPAMLFLDELFNNFGVSKQEWQKLISSIEKWKKELEEVVIQYYKSASRTIISTLQVGDESSIKNTGKHWSQILPTDIQSLLKDDSARAIIERFSFPYDNDNSLIDSISSLLIGKRIEKWDDSTITLFDREFKSIIHRIEDEALGSPLNTNAGEKVAVDLLCARIDTLYKRLESIVGTKTALSHFQKVSNRY